LLRLQDTNHHHYHQQQEKEKASNKDHSMEQEQQVEAMLYISISTSSKTFFDPVSNQPLSPRQLPSNNDQILIPDPSLPSPSSSPSVIPQPTAKPKPQIPDEDWVVQCFQRGSYKDEVIIYSFLVVVGSLLGWAGWRVWVEEYSGGASAREGRGGGLNEGFEWLRGLFGGDRGNGGGNRGREDGGRRYVSL
jgi:hypothetical protein